MSPTKRQSIPCIDPNDDGGRSVYTLTDARTGETQDVTVCMKHGEEMPLIDGDLVRARPADTGAMCDFTPIGERTSDDVYAMDPNDPDDAIMLAMSGIVPLDEPGLITEQSMKTRTGMGSEFPTFARKLTTEEVAERDRGYTGSNARTRQPIPRWYGEFEDE